MATALLEKDMNRVISLLQKRSYIKAKEIARILYMKPNRVYRCINEARFRFIGIQPTPKGYVLSVSATKKDDVHLLRRFFGMRNNMYIMHSGCADHMKKRWSRIPAKENLLITMNSMAPAYGEVEKGYNMLLRVSKKLGM